MSTRGGGDRRFNGGGGSWGDGGRSYGRSVRNYGGDRPYGGGRGRMYDGRGTVAYYHGANVYQGGAPLCGPGFYTPVVYRYARPRSYVSLGINLGSPYPPPAYVYDDRPAPVVQDPEPQIDVENEPPAGCYYYDPFCGREFSNLDEYTDHINQEGHAKTIEIIVRDSGEQLRTLEFANGSWSVQR
jgi:hypothetical protein